MDPPMLCWDLGHPACRAAAWHCGEPRNEKMEGKDLDDMKIMQHKIRRNMEKQVRRSDACCMPKHIETQFGHFLFQLL